MIFLAYASPMPGSATRSAWLAELRSTSSCLAAGLVSLVPESGGGGGLLADGLSPAFWACPMAGAKNNETASVTPPRICLRDMALLVPEGVGLAVTTIAPRRIFNRRRDRN